MFHNNINVMGCLPFLLINRPNNYEKNYLINLKTNLTLRGSLTIENNAEAFYFIIFTVVNY